MHKITNGRGEMATNTTEIQAILREYYEKLCQLTGQPGRNGQISRNLQATKTEPGRKRKLEQTHN